METNTGTQAESKVSTIARKVKRWTIGILLVAVLLGLVGGGYYMFGDYSDGYRIGTVLKFSRKGIAFKTYEGQLDLGTFDFPTTPGDARQGRIWDFSVDGQDKEVIEAIEAASERNAKVKLYYHEKFVQMDWRGETTYFVYKVEEIKK